MILFCCQVAAKRRLVETATKISGRLQMAVREGLELAAKIFQPQLPQVDGITEEEIKRLKVICSNAPKVC
jgi:hypothetical protein